MKPTLQERLVSEARAKYVRYSPEIGDYIDSFDAKDLDQIILHTIEQTIKEGCEVIEGMKKDEVKWQKAKYDVKSVEAVCYNRGVTDTQHALRGIIK